MPMKDWISITPIQFQFPIFMWFTEVKEVVFEDEDVMEDVIDVEDKEEWENGFNQDDYFPNDGNDDALYENLT